MDSEPARVCDSLTQSAQQSDDSSRIRSSRPCPISKIPGGHEFARLAVHDPAQQLLQRHAVQEISPDRSTGRGRSRYLELRATQEKYIEFQDVLKDLARLAPEQREAIVLIAAEGLSYEEAAAVCNCPVGTVKSRLSRARQRLEEYANGEPARAKRVA